MCVFVFKTNCVACKRGTQFSCNIKVNFVVKNWLGGYLLAFQYEDPGFDPRFVHIMFALGKVALGQNFLPVMRLYPVSSGVPKGGGGLGCSNPPEIPKF
jgi:hypothetical protein